MTIDTYQAGDWFPVPAVCYPDRAVDPERLARLWSRRVPGALFSTGAHTYQAGRRVSPLPTPPERPNVYLPTPVPPPPAPWLASVELPDVPELNAPCQSEAEARALFSAWCTLIDHLQLWGHPCRARLWSGAPVTPGAEPAYMLLQTYDPSTGAAEGVGGPTTVRDIDPSAHTHWGPEQEAFGGRLDCPGGTACDGLKPNGAVEGAAAVLTRVQ